MMDREIRIIVAGGRDFDDYTMLRSTIHNLLFALIDRYDDLEKSNIRFISGSARGADSLGEKYANNYGYNLSRFPADWDNLGKSAGYIRNKQMAEFAIDDNSIGILLAFWDGKSKGTKHMIDLAKKNDLEVIIIEI